MTHTKEPWSNPYYQDSGWWIHNGKQGGDEYAIAVTFSLNPNGEADARRVVACVNACEGLTLEELESFVGMSVKEEIERGVRHCIEYKQRNSDLVEALDIALNSLISIRAYSKDGKIAVECANKENMINKVLKAAP
jgi:hypothetical protein